MLSQIPASTSSIIGTRRQRLGNFKRRIQLLKLLVTVTSSRMVHSFLADWTREARGSLFKILTKGSVERSSVDAWVPACGNASVEGVSHGSGAIPDPGHRSPTGPCTRMAPSFLKGVGRRQILQGARVATCSSVKAPPVGAVYTGSAFIFYSYQLESDDSETHPK